MGAMPVLVGRAGKLSKSGGTIMMNSMGSVKVKDGKLKLELRRCKVFRKSGFGRDDEASSPQLGITITCLLGTRQNWWYDLVLF
jgi:hypothetical protein